MTDRRHLCIEVSFRDGWLHGSFRAGEDAPAVEVSYVPNRVRELRATGFELYRLFEAGPGGAWPEERFRSFGQKLEEDWLPAIGPEESPGLESTLVTIEAAQAEVLALPWELLCAWKGFLALISDFGIERRVPCRGPAPVFEPSSLPLRLLFLAAGPQGLPVLDQEAEQEALQSLLAESPGRFVAAGVLTGTFEDLHNALARQRPHILHLSGHGVVAEGEGRFFFESLDGKPDPVPVREIAAAAVDAGVKLVVLNACQSGIAPDFDALAGMCQSLVAAGVPYALGWAGAIHDPAALTFAEVFYRALAEHGSVHRAVSRARNGLVAMSEKLNRPFWALPVLYTSVREPLDFAVASEPGPQQGTAPAALWPAGLIGRRREIQLVLASLLEHDAVAVFVTGAHGLGKTALLELVLPLLAERLGMPVVHLTGTEAEPITGRSLLSALTEGYRLLGENFLTGILTDEAKPLYERLLMAAGASYEVPLLCCVDGVEWMASEEFQRAGEEQAWPLWAVVSSLFNVEETRSRFLLAGRFQPFGECNDRVVHLPLGELSPGEALKLLLRNRTLRERVERRDLPPHLVEYLVLYLGGIPGLLLKAQEALARVGAAALEEELATLCTGWVRPLDLPSLRSPESQRKRRKGRTLHRIMERYFNEARLFHLAEMLQTAGESQRTLFALCLVYRTPVPLPAWQLVGESADEEEVLRFLSAGKALGLILETQDSALGHSWRFSSLMRQWLLPVLEKPIRTNAHSMAGYYFLIASLREPPWAGDPLWLTTDSPSVSDPDEGNLLEQLRPDWEESFQAAFEHFLLAHDGESLAWCWPLLVRLVDLNQIDRAERLVAAALEENEHPNLLLVKAEIAEARGLHAETAEAYRRIVAVGEVPGALCSPREAQTRLARLEGGTAEERPRENLEKLQPKVTSLLRKHAERTRSSPGWKDLLRELLSPGFFEGQLLSVQLQIATANAQLQGDFESARALAHQCLDRARQRGDRAGTVFALRRLGEIDFEDGRHDDALQRLGEALLYEALRLADGLGDPGESAEIRQMMANVEEQRANRSAARDHLERAAQLLVSESGPGGEFLLLERLIGLDLELKDFETARQRLARALKAALELDDLERILEARSNLARVLHREGRAAESEEQLREGLRLARERGDWPKAIEMLFHLGMFCAAVERPGEACAVFDEALREAETHDRESAFLPAILLRLAEAQRSLERAPEARSTLERCLQAAEKEDDWPTRAEALSLLAGLELAASGPAAAIPPLEEARRICRVLDDFASYTSHTGRIAVLHLKDGNAETAEKILLNALRELGEARRGRPEEEARLYCHLARLSQTRGDLRDALVSIARAWERVEDGPWKDGRYAVFRTFAELARALDQREACLQLLALGAMLQGVRTGIYEEDLSDLIAQAEEWGRADDVSALIEQCTGEYLFDAASGLMSELLEICAKELGQIPPSTP